MFRKFFLITTILSFVFVSCKSQNTDSNTKDITIAFEAGNGGELSAEIEGDTTIHSKSPITVQKGKMITFTAKNASGYVINQWNVTGGKFENGTGKKGSAIAKLKVINPCNVSVSFRKTTSPTQSYEVEFKAGENGSVKAVREDGTEETTSPIVVEQNKIITFIATGKTSEYIVKKWEIEGGEFEAGTGGEGQNTARVKITGPTQISVSFKSNLPDGYNRDTGVGVVSGIKFIMKEIPTSSMIVLGDDVEDDNPIHPAKITTYRMQETEVTQELWQAIMEHKPSYFDGSVGDKVAKEGEVQENRPVDQVNWYHAIAFCNKLSIKTNLEPCYKVLKNGNPIDFATLKFEDIPTVDDADWNKLTLDTSKTGFRLPTEAEWEWAAKGGTNDTWAGCSNETELADYAWTENNSEGKTHEVAKKKPNGYGLFDMSGNVIEWCHDIYNKDLPSPLPTNYKGAATGKSRVTRGGNWQRETLQAKVSFRNSFVPRLNNIYSGFRLVAKPIIPIHKVTFEAGEGGTLEARIEDESTPSQSPLNVEKGTTINFTATANPNYKISTWEGLEADPADAATVAYTVNGDVKIKVNFEQLSSGEATYKVEHYKEQIDETYPDTTTEVDILTGTVGSAISPTLKTYEGFEKDKIEPVSATITSDGNTVVKVFYKRKMINLTFSLEGGNVDGNTADVVRTGKYGTVVTPPLPKKEGNLFLGWLPKTPTHYPIADASYKASWQVSKYSVNFEVSGNNGSLKAVDENGNIIKISPITDVEHGKLLTFIATANAGFCVDKWTVEPSTALQAGTGLDESENAKVVISAETTVRVSFKTKAVAVPTVREYTAGTVKFNVVDIQGGVATLGVKGNKNNPLHQIKLSPYSIGETEVTQELWQEVMGENPSHFNGTEGKEAHAGEEQNKRPVENIDWFLAIAFCNELSKKVTNVGATECVYYNDKAFTNVYTKEDAVGKKIPFVNTAKKGFRLPTEAEWEWAAKGGGEHLWAGCDEEATLGNYAWYSQNSSGKTHEVKKKEANGYGLYDMSGNVWELCYDANGKFPDPIPDDYMGATTGYRIRRGGSWKSSNTAEITRYYRGITFRADNSQGLRIALKQ